MAHEEWSCEVLGLEQSPEVLHVGFEGIARWLCPATISMPTQIHGQHPTIARQGRPDQIKPMGIGTTAVDQDKGLRTRTSVVEVVQAHVLQLQVFTGTIALHAHPQLRLLSVYSSSRRAGPPSMLIVAPVIKLEASEARKMVG